MDKIKFKSNNYENLFSGRASWLDNDPINFFNEDGNPDVEIEGEDEEEFKDVDDLHSDFEDKTTETEEDSDIESSDDSEDPGEPPSLDDEEETDTEEVETKTTEGPDDYDLKEFGNHGGPDVPNNQYNEKDVEILNKLISSESDAINDYFDATTNTVDTNLSRLYGDIGREERFHLEQLLYAKSLITGEKYEPKDPEVKEEYEKLIGDGMDEDTAIVTTIDKISISKPVDDKEFDELKEDVAQTESYLMQSAMMVDMMFDSDVYPKLVQEYVNEYNIVMEDVLNTSDLSYRDRNGINPIVWLIEHFVKLIKFLRKLGKMVRDHMMRTRGKRTRMRAYVQKYGLGVVLKNGYSFYTYNDESGTFKVSDLILYADLAYRTTQQVAQSCGLQINRKAPVDATQYGLHPMQVGSADAGVEKIRGMILTKTKLVVVKNNQDYIINTLFGYSDTKVERSTADIDASGKETTKVEKLSKNFYNIATVALDQITNAALIAEEVLRGLQGLEGVADSVYTRNFNKWDTAVKQMRIIMNGFQKITNAINHDLNTMLKIDEEVYKLTTAHDAAAQKGQKFEGETRRVNDAPAPGTKPGEKPVVSRFM